MRRIAVIAAASAALLLSACGSDDNASGTSGASGGSSSSSSDGGGGGGAYGKSSGTSSSGGGGATLKISADPGGAKKFTESSLSTSAGKVTIEFSNQSQLPHAVEIEGNGIEKSTDTVTGADAAPLTVDLKPGTYTYYCPVGDHRAEGMEGKLTVR
jgi:plastocyanin